MDCSLGFKSENQEVKLRSYSPSGGLRPYKSYAVRIFSYTHFEEMIVNLGTIHLRRRQIFTIFDPYPPTICIPAKCLLYRRFSILMYCDLLTIGFRDTPPPLRHADVFMDGPLGNRQLEKKSQLWQKYVHYGFYETRKLNVY